MTHETHTDEQIRELATGGEAHQHLTGHLMNDHRVEPYAVPLTHDKRVVLHGHLHAQSARE